MVNTPDRFFKYQGYFLLATLEGIAAFYFSIATRSMERNAWLLGFSVPRLLLAAAILVAILIFAWCGTKAFTDRAWLKSADALVERLTTNRRRLLLTLLGLSLIAIVGVGLVYAWSSRRLASLPYVLQVGLERITPALVWAALVSIQTLGILSQPLREDFRNKLDIQPEKFGVVLLTSSLILAFFHWAVLFWRLPVFEEIPDWFWNFRERKLGFQELVFIAILVLVSFVLQRVLQKPEQRRRNVLIIVALGYMVQLGFGVAQGQGFESLRLKYLSSGTSTFLRNACGEVNVLESVRRYDELYGSGFWEGTKPPGLQALFTLFGRALGAGVRDESHEACANRSSNVAAYLFPLLAVLVIFPLLWMGDMLGIESRASYLAAILFITLPNFTQFPLFHDQFLFPLVFMLAMALILFAVQKNSCTHCKNQDFTAEHAESAENSLYNLRSQRSLPANATQSIIEQAGRTQYDNQAADRQVVEKAFLQHAHSFWLAILAGIFVYIAIFISFSLLPLVGFALLWPLMQMVSTQRSGRWMDALKILAGIALGAALAALVGYLVLGYDPLARYQAAFAQHRDIKFFRGRMAQLWLVLLINNIEYLALIGLPMAIAAIYQTMVSFLKYVGNQESRMDLFAVALLILYLGLNVLGQTRGEVARIWLFLAPGICLVGAYGLMSVYRSWRWPVFLMVGLQLATAMMVFQFQDYGCKLCP